MIFRYDIKINGDYVDIEQGFTLTEDKEEALDGGKLKLILNDNPLPLEQYSFIQIDISQVNNLGVIVSKKYYERLIISDEVLLNTKYGYYEHSLTLLEFTSKMDLYQKSAFQFSKDIFSNRDALYEYVLDLELPISPNHKANELMSEGYDNDIYFISYDKRALINGVKIPQIIHELFSFNQISRGKYLPMFYWQDSYNNFDKNNIIDVKLYLRTNAPITNNRILVSEQNVEWELPVGNWEIYLGFEKPEEVVSEPVGLPPIISPARDVDVFKYYVDVRSKYKDTLYDVVMELRDLVSKYGGIESKLYFNQTRMFDLSDDDAEYLKTVEAPQIYIPSATLRQMLVFILSFVNAVPRLVRGSVRDTLHLDYFGKSLGKYIKENITESYSEQNTNQIGTRSYADLHNILPNDLNSSTTYSPYQDGYQTVRATNIQLIDDGGFELKLPKSKPIYKLNKFSIALQYGFYKSDESNNDYLLKEGYIELDLTEVLINNSEWQLKEITSNFPNAYYTRQYQQNVGLNMYKTENIAWKEGDTSINLSMINGQLFKSSLLESVMKHEINKLNTEYDFDEYEWRYTFKAPDINRNPLWFKNILFNVEYITNENMSIKQDKEDLEQISFYSEVRQNQDENTISLARSSSKMYGDLQRTGNKNNTFNKVHRSLDEMYEVGMTDNDNNTITSIQAQFFNDYIEVMYTTTKHHNRISQATFIDQTYRWRDNFASELKQRNETYNDYMFLIPKGMNVDEYGDKKVVDENTKIVAKEMYPQTTNVPYIYKVLFGILGVKHEVEKTKATVGLVRTNGTIESMPDTSLNNQRQWNLISVPLSSAGFKGGLTFKIGFEDNQVVGDGLVQEGVNWYNRAVKYTDRNARIKFFDFYILNKVPSPSNRNDYPKYVANTGETNKPVFLSKNTLATNDNVLYFSTGDLEFNNTAEDSLIVNKDPMSNFNLNYSLNIMSYYYGLFVFGREFFVRNQMVNNNYSSNTSYLYVYNNNEKYNIFEDIKIKNGYKLKTRIINNVIIKIENDDVILEVLGLTSDITSWAIGDEFGNLYLACNERISEVELVKTHFRPNVNVVGEKINGIKSQNDLNNEISIIEQSIVSEMISVINDMEVVERTVIGIKVSSNLSNEISIIEQTISSEMIGVNNYLQTSEYSIIGIKVPSNLKNEINIIEQNINGEMISVINDIATNERMAIKIKVNSSLSSEINIIEQNIVSEVININNNLLVFNDIEAVELMVIDIGVDSNLSSEILIVEQSIISEMISVNNTLQTSEYSIIGLKVSPNLDNQINIIEQNIVSEVININNNLLVFNNIHKREKYAVGLSNPIEVIEQNIIGEMISVKTSLMPILAVKVPTKTPTVSAIYCKLQSGRNNIFVDVTNNDENRVYLHKNGSIFGILEIGETRSVFIQASNSLPNYFTVDIYVIDVNGNKLKSNTVTKSGTITYCLP